MKNLPLPYLNLHQAWGDRRFPYRRLFAGHRLGVGPSSVWKSATASLLFFPAAAFAAVTPTEWTHRQTVEVTTPGLVKIPVPAATFDNARPELVDLRLLDATGREAAYLIDRDLSYHRQSMTLEAPKATRPRSFRATTTGDSTQLLIETGTAKLPESMTLETAAPWFLKAAHVEISPDGETWESTGPAVPVFRQFGAEQLRLALPHRDTPFAFVRVTLGDFRSRRVEFSGASLQPAPVHATPPALVPVGAVITRRDEFAGETVLTVTLDGKNVPLAELVLEAGDALFMRRVTVTIREVRGDVPDERVLATGTVYRVALEGAPAQSQLAVPLDFPSPTRELLVHIHNGDSPPLALDGVQARQHPVSLLFPAPIAGRYTLLSGNPQVTAPRYDLAAFAGEMRTAAATTAVPGALEPVPGYHPRDSLAEPPLPDVPLAGAPLDPKDWLYRRTVQISHAGVQELELDPEALARGRPDFADLRLMRNGNQIPYVLEKTTLSRSLALTPTVTPDAKRPSFSVWRLTLPQAGLPLQRLVLTCATPLFSRELRIYENVTGTDSRTHTVTLAAGAWSRTPEPGMPETRIFELPGRTQTDTLWIETDNGDNPAIVLGAVQAVHPVVRLVFKVAETGGCTLAYGNSGAAAPRYDLSLVAVKLLTAERHIAQLADGGQPVAAGSFLTRLNHRYLLWGALTLVVVVLLGVVAKLLPKPPPT